MVLAPVGMNYDSQSCPMPTLIYEIHRLALVHNTRKLVYTSSSLLPNCTLNYILRVHLD